MTDNVAVNKCEASNVIYVKQLLPLILKLLCKFYINGRLVLRSIGGLIAFTYSLSRKHPRNTVTILTIS